MTLPSATILAIDPGATSGAAILSPNGLAYRATVKTAAHRRGIVSMAIEAATKAAPLVVVGESWKGRAGRTVVDSNIATLCGLGASWGRWAEACELAGIPKRRTLRLDTGTWRKRLFGGRRVKSEVWKAKAIAFVRGRFGVDVSHDEADAICIGVAAQIGPEILKVLPRVKI